MKAAHTTLSSPKHILVTMLMLATLVLAPFGTRAQTGSNGHDANEPEGMVSVNIKAHQCPSADLALVLLGGNPWIPWPAKDGCAPGSAGQNTFRIASGFSWPLTIYPIEAIDPDDGTVSLWWSIWSDDPVLIEGAIHNASNPVSGGGGDITTQAYTVDSPKLIITDVELPNDEVSFTTQEGENSLVCFANLLPDTLDATYNDQLQWEIEDDPNIDGASPVPDVAELRGDEVTLVIDIPNDADGRDYHTLNYRIRAKLPINGTLTYSLWWPSIVQDEIDMLRQQYIDMGKESVPGRGSFINSGSTAHFNLSEGACHCGHHSYHLWSAMNNLESVRANLGHAMSINSGYRCPIHNAAQSGAPNSQHIYGTAADVAVDDWDGNGATDTDGNGIDDDWETLESAARTAGASYIEEFEDTGTWVHMDWR